MENEKKIAILWSDLSFEVQSILTRKKSVILNKMSGFVEFGSLTAVMGPSGSGLTSLLMCLNGMNNSKLSEDTKIRLNTSEKIRSTFIGHNVKEFLILSLTAKQNLIYASKLKNSNCGQEVDHEKNVQDIMSDLLITDTMNTKASSCSGGEQKRLAIGLELTALNKPNVIFFDEPTSGLDSFVAEVVIKCLKELSFKQNISIITSIHQPNSDVLQMYDNLYVLAKEGVCVYWGTPQHLPIHLRDCGIICNKNQVPIETLIMVGSKGSDDKTVIDLRNNTYSETKESIERRIYETKQKTIIHKNKAFSFKDVYLLLERGFTEFISYKYIGMSTDLSALLLLALIIAVLFPFDVGDYDDCIIFNNTIDRSCLEQAEMDMNVFLDQSYLATCAWLLQVLYCLLVVMARIPKLKVFMNEHRNKWYSSGVYYLTESITDLIPNTIGAAVCSVLTFFISSQPNEAKRFWAYFYAYQLQFHVINELANLMAIVMFRYETLCILLSVLVAFSGGILSNFIVQLRYLPDIIQIIADTSIFNFVFNMIAISIFGFDRCKQDQVSKSLYLTELTDDDKFWEHSGYLWIQYISFKSMAFISMIAIQNPSFFNYLYKYLNNKTQNRRSNEIELQTIQVSEHEFQSHCYENTTEIDLKEEIIVSEETSISNVSSMKEKEGEDEEKDPNRTLSIAWIDFTLKVEKTFYSKEKLILRGIKGFIEFGTLTALMGPSGAGKTSLLKGLNGFYRNLMTKESKIYLSNRKKTMTCFIAQDQREHIICGLTVKQALIYASKLKNTGKTVDHETNVTQLLTELAINDIENNNIEKCSSGQQKRIVMAMELTADVKPNLIFVDEPTTNVDSYSATLMIKFYRIVAKKYSLSIITSIHQPNLEILMTFDTLYVLAKGGVTVYSGRPQDLRRHLNECDITCNEDQIPIEVLLKLGSKGYNDSTVIASSETTNREMSKFDERLTLELKHFPNGIPIETKTMSLEELWHSLVRMVIFTVRYNWVQLLFQYALYFVCGAYLLAHFDFDLEKAIGCEPKFSNSCVLTFDKIEENRIVGYSRIYLFVVLQIAELFVLFSSALSFSSLLKVFDKEFRNHWYSSDSFFLVKTFMDLIPTLLIIICYTAIANTNYKDFDCFPDLLFALTLQSISYQFLGYICAIMPLISPITGCMVVYSSGFLFADLYVTDWAFDKFIQELCNFIPLRHAYKHMLVLFYGFDRCSEDQFSSLMFKHALDDDDFDKSTHLLIILAFFYFILSYVGFKVKANWESIEMGFLDLKKRLM